MERWNKPIGVAALVVAASVFGCSNQTDSRMMQEEIEKWRGRWQCVARIEGGEPIPEEEAATITLTVGGTLYHFRWGDDFDELGRYTFHPDRDPKVMEVAIESPPELAGRRIQVIYKIDGDTLLLAHREDMTLPKDFTSDPESGQTLEIWKRVKP